MSEKMFKEVSRELARRLSELDTSIDDKPPTDLPDRTRLVVTWTVRKPTGGLPFRWEYVAPKGVWKVEAEHLAKMAIRKAKLIPHAHIDTTIELRKAR